MVLRLALHAGEGVGGGTVDGGLLGGCQAGGVKRRGAGHHLVVVGRGQGVGLPAGDEAEALHIAEGHIARCTAGRDGLHGHIVYIPIGVIGSADMAESYAGIGGHTGHFHLILGVCSAVGGGIVDNRDKSTGIFNVGHITHREGACRGSAGTVPETDLQGVGGGIHLGQYNLVVLRAGADIRAESITSAVRIGRIVVADKGITAARSRLRHISPAVDLENTALIAVEVLAEGYGLLAAGGAEADGGRPVAVALGAAVGAHAHLVGGVGRKARQGVGVGGGVDHRPFGSAADAVVNLPCIVGAVAVGPADHGGGGGDILRGHGQGRGHHAALQGGEAHHGALFALHAAVAQALHLDSISCFRLQTSEADGSRCGIVVGPHRDSLTCDGNIVHIQAVIAAVAGAVLGVVPAECMCTHAKHV